jgi:hypothetical protein
MTGFILDPVSQLTTTRDLDEFPVFFSENGDPYVFRTHTGG